MVINLTNGQQFIPLELFLSCEDCSNIVKILLVKFCAWTIHQNFLPRQTLHHTVINGLSGNCITITINDKSYMREKNFAVFEDF